MPEHARDAAEHVPPARAGAAPQTDQPEDPADPYPLAPRVFAAFGERRQLLALAEELSEAAAAVARLLNGKGDRAEVLEELVDVEAVTASLRAALGPPEAWGRVRAEKRAKLARKLASGNLRTRPGVVE